jgi:SpoVK/Ycf46/Vps4 family AAA+-type ATPase
MNNSIQNIILQGMEDLDGILIATTNLEGSLDPAFERRFLYKIKFELPSVDSRGKMWKSMIPELTDDDCTMLAKEFQFSGGQIENIARKNEVEYILYGTSATIESIRSFCGQELIAGKHRHMKIGF